MIGQSNAETVFSIRSGSENWTIEYRPTSSAVGPILGTLSKQDGNATTAAIHTSLLHRGFDVLLLKIYALDGNVRELCARR